MLARADVVLCEDTRHSRTLLAHFSIATPTRPYHEHNAARERPRVLRELEAGAPRRAHLRRRHAARLRSRDGSSCAPRSTPATGSRRCPGASAALAASSVAGLPTDAFFFAGFLPPKGAARRTRIAELQGRVPATLLFFEAPSRVAETLADLAAVLGDRPAALARELTKLHEEVRRAPLERAGRAGGRGQSIKGEVVILVGPPQKAEVTDAEIAARLAPALEEMSLRDAAKVGGRGARRAEVARL